MKGRMIEYPEVHHFAFFKCCLLVTNKDKINKKTSSFLLLPSKSTNHAKVNPTQRTNFHLHSPKLTGYTASLGKLKLLLHVLKLVPN